MFYKTWEIKSLYLSSSSVVCVMEGWMSRRTVQGRKTEQAGGGAEGWEKLGERCAICTCRSLPAFLLGSVVAFSSFCCHRHSWVPSLLLEFLPMTLIWVFFCRARHHFLFFFSLTEEQACFINWSQRGNDPAYLCA